MIIKADNRGRIALGKLNGANLAHTEWDVTLASGTFTVKPVEEKPKSEWYFHTYLNADMVGQVVRIRGIRQGQKPGYLPKGTDYISEVTGVLESYSTEEGAEWVRLKGCPEVIWLTAEANQGMEYGTVICFGLKE